MTESYGSDLGRFKVTQD